MTGVTVGDWLKSDGLRQKVEAAGLVAWGDVAVTSESRCPFDGSVNALDEGARQMAFLGGPRVIERLAVPGRRVDLIGQPVTLQADAVGYRDGAAVFVIDANEQESEGSTVLKVVRGLT